MLDDHVIGVDGCPAGWLVCTLPREGPPRFTIAPTAAALHERAAAGALTLIDIPIGLPPGPPRDCDLAAKRILGRWNARVFLTPPRAAFDAADYPAASAVARKRSGRGLMKQMWCIMPKIREIDALLAEHGPAIGGGVRECHPEICFWGLAGGDVVGANKKTLGGRTERLRILSRFIPNAEAVAAAALEQLPDKAAAPDDVLDAMACAVTAAGVFDDALRTLPRGPARDEADLPMEMVYRQTRRTAREDPSAGAAMQEPPHTGRCT